MGVQNIGCVCVCVCEEDVTGELAETPLKAKVDIALPMPEEPAFVWGSEPCVRAHVRCEHRKVAYVCVICCVSLPGSPHVDVYRRCLHVGVRHVLRA